MTNGEILKYDGIIKNLIDNATDINSLAKFRLLGMLKQFEPIEQNYNTIREDNIRKLGTMSDDGRFGIFEPKREAFEDDDSFNTAFEDYEKTIKAFDDALNDVLNSESDIEIKKFKYGDIMNAGIPTKYLVAIYDLIEE